MSSDFPTPPEELQRAAEEIARLRQELQNASAVLGRIEKRLKLAFPNYPQRKLPAKRDLQASAALPGKTRDQLLALFETILATTKERGEQGFALEIEKLSEQDLPALAFELGISDSRRISIKKAREGIRRRVQESLLLSSHHRERDGAQTRTQSVDPASSTALKPESDD